MEYQRQRKFLTTAEPWTKGSGHFIDPVAKGRERGKGQQWKSTEFQSSPPIKIPLEKEPDLGMWIYR